MLECRAEWQSRKSRGFVGSRSLEDILKDNHTDNHKDIYTDNYTDILMEMISSWTLDYLDILMDM